MTQIYPFIPYKTKIYPEKEMLERSQVFYNWASKRRSVREFSNKPVPQKIIENIVRTAGTAPSGANKQPWTFVVIGDSKIKHQIRIAAETEEKELYQNKISDEWRRDLAPLQTDWKKPFLEIAPYLIIVFRQNYNLNETSGSKGKHYYVMESVGIAVGMLIMAIHNAGLITLTHTPNPMDFLGKILGRPKNEKAYVLMPVGYPGENVQVPDITRKNLDQIMIIK